MFYRKEHRAYLNHKGGDLMQSERVSAGFPGEVSMMSMNLPSETGG